MGGRDGRSVASQLHTRERSNPRHSASASCGLWCRRITSPKTRCQQYHKSLKKREHHDAPKAVQRYRSCSFRTAAGRQRNGRWNAWRRAAGACSPRLSSCIAATNRLPRRCSGHTQKCASALRQMARAKRSCAPSQSSKRLVTSWRFAAPRMLATQRGSTGIFSPPQARCQTSSTTRTLGCRTRASWPQRSTWTSRPLRSGAPTVWRGIPSKPRQRVARRALPNGS